MSRQANSPGICGRLLPERARVSTELSELQPIHAVVVTFNPDLVILSHTLVSLVPLVDGIVVVDNGCSEAVRRHLQTLAERGEIVLVRQARNIGLAAAQNLGVDVARQRGAGAVLLLDQDSELEPMMVHRLKEAWAAVAGLRAPSGAGGAILLLCGNRG